MIGLLRSKEEKKRNNAQLLAVKGSRNENISFVHILLDIYLTFLERKHKF